MGKHNGGRATGDAQKNGFSLGGTLLAVALLAVLGVALASMGMTHLRLVTHTRNRTTLSNAARTVVERGIAKVFERGNSTAQTPPTLPASIVYDRDGVHAVLRFEELKASDDDVPISVDNLDSTVSKVIPGTADVLPAATARLVGRATGYGQVREIEALLYIPPFPYALASEGQLSAPGGLVVGELLSYPVPSIDTDSLPKLGPADIGCNNPAADSIVLGGNSEVSGNIDSSGGVQAENTVMIYGQLRSQLPAVKVPTIEVSTYDPDGASHSTPNTPYPGDGIALTGVHRHNGPLVVNKPLRIINGFLYVNGDLTATQGVLGQGVVAATGDITIHGGTKLESSGATDLALVCGGKLTLTGGGPAMDSFSGVVYAGGGISATSVSIVGTLVAGNANVPVTLENVAVYEKPGEVGVKSGIATSLGTPVELGDWVKFREILSLGDPLGVQRGEVIGGPAGGQAMLRVELSLNSLGPPIQWKWTLTGLDDDGATNLAESGVGGQFELGEDLKVVLGSLIGFEGGVPPRLYQVAADSIIGSSGPANAPNPTVNPAIILQDLSKVLSMADKVRILRWEES